MTAPDGDIEVDTTAPPMSRDDFAMSIGVSLDYAASALTAYGMDLDESHPLVAAMAAEMTDAWFNAAEQWMRDHAGFLSLVPHLPRECWCGQWPDLGTGCYYHGGCRCIELRRSDYERDRWVVRSPGRAYGIAPNHQIALPGDCPVHFGTEVPVEHAARLYKRLRAATPDSRPHGRPLSTEQNDA